MYKRFLEYKLIGKITFGFYQHLDGDGGFRSKENEYKNKIVVVQRKKYEQNNLKRNKALSD